MDPRAAKDLLRRLRLLERQQVRLRRGVVTNVSPLSVALGGSDTPYTDVAALAGTTFVVDDQVAVLVAGNDLLVLGRLA